MTESKYWSLKPFYSKIAFTSIEKKKLVKLGRTKNIQTFQDIKCDDDEVQGKNVYLAIIILLKKKKKLITR